MILYSYSHFSEQLCQKQHLVVTVCLWLPRTMILILIASIRCKIFHYQVITSLLQALYTCIACKHSTIYTNMQCAIKNSTDCIQGCKIYQYCNIKVSFFKDICNIAFLVHTVILYILQYCQLIQQFLCKIVINQEYSTITIVKLLDLLPFPLFSMQNYYYVTVFHQVIKYSTIFSNTEVFFQIQY